MKDDKSVKPYVRENSSCWFTDDAEPHPQTGCPSSGYRLGVVTNGKERWINCSRCNRTWHLKTQFEKDSSLKGEIEITRKVRHEVPAKEKTMNDAQTIEAGNSLPQPLGSDCICFGCGMAPHNGGDGDCACEQNPWFDVDRCGPCKHNLDCDVARNPHLYPRDPNTQGQPRREEKQENV